MNLCLLILLLLLIASCEGYKDKSAIYSVATYVKSSDQINTDKHSMSDYSEYNSDSNLVYEEVYGDPPSDQPYLKSYFSYNGKRKVSQTNCYDEYYMRERHIDTVRFTFEYSGDNLVREFTGGKLLTSYEYDSSNRITREIKFSPSQKNENALDSNLTVIPTSKIELPWQHVDYQYDNNGRKVRTMTFNSDTLLAIDTFIYNSKGKVIEYFSFNRDREMTDHELYTRDSGGKVTEKKWRDHFGGIILSDFLKGVDPEFWFTSKFFYDSFGHNIRIEYFEHNRLAEVYEYEWK